MSGKVVVSNKRVRTGLGIGGNKELLFHIFALPWILGILIFFLFPAFMSFYYSLTSYDIVTAPKFIGMENYANLFANDELFITCLLNTLYMVAFSLTLNLVLQLVMALLMNWDMKGIF